MFSVFRLDSQFEDSLRKVIGNQWVEIWESEVVRIDGVVERRASVEQDGGVVGWVSFERSAGL